ncbi:MAG: RagB/SusD family nutrient uptake outer membrane protein [Filimonas sp.]|nr:RagB/SusD family nutrient uptake outer membrane protein [Filimonas sp.]
MKNICTIFLLILVSGLSSCHKFLAEQSQDQLTPTTTTDFLQLLYGQAYPGFDQGSAMQRGLLFMDDDFQMNNLYKGSLTNTADNIRSADIYLPMYAWQPDAYDQIASSGLAGNKTNYNTWARYYTLIMGANIALDNADISTGSDDDKNYLKGQAYGLRAYYYFMLVNFYGAPYNAAGKDPASEPGVPLILTAKIEKADLYNKRNTVKEVYDQVISDMNNSILYLEKNKRFNAYRMNYLAVHLLASRVYLYMENWSKVIEQANIVLAAKAGLMNLSSPIAQSTSATNLILGAGNVETLWTYGTYTDYATALGNSQIYRLSNDLLRCYTSNDLRIKNTFIGTNSAVTLAGYGYTQICNKQYRNDGATMKAFRVAEAYLNRAEAYLHLAANGDADSYSKGLADLNTLRGTRYTNPPQWTTTTMPAVTSALDSCKLERRKELFLEDHRWFDLRRYGMPAITHVYYRSSTDSVKYTLSAGDKQYIWAIPQEVLDRNYLLTQNEVGGLRVYSTY